MAAMAWNKSRRMSMEQASPRRGRRSASCGAGTTQRSASSSPSCSRSGTPPRRRDVLRNLVVKAVRAPRAGVATEYRGVRYREELNKYVTEIRPTRSTKKIWLGTYDTAEEAARAFDIGNLCCKKNLPLNFPDSPRMLKRISSRLSPDEARSAIAKLAKEVARVVISSASSDEAVKRKEVDRAAAMKAHELVQIEADEFQARHLEAAASSVTYTEQLEENINVLDDEFIAAPVFLADGSSWSDDLSQVVLDDDLAGIPDLDFDVPDFATFRDSNGDVFYYTI